MAKQNCPVIVPVALLLLGTLAILLLTIPADDIREPPEFMYGIVMDAGSSHTTVYVYKWPADKQNGTGIVTQHSECDAKGGGISSYAGQQGGAARSLEDCLDKASRDIPRARHRLTPVYLGATAGMRLLNISSPSESDQILKEVGQKIQSYPFDFRGAVILSGQEEGAYGWVTANYLLENFVKYGFVGHWLSTGKETVGALDFGGASTQITFETQDTVEDKSSQMNLRLYGRDYTIYTHSFLCYGQDQALRRLLAHLLESQGNSNSISNPCYPAGHSVSTTMGAVFDSPCTAGRKPTPYNPQGPLTVLGSGHYQHCLGNVSQVFSFSDCSFSKCSFDGTFQPNVTGSFMAFSAFYYIHASLERLTGITVTTPEQLAEATSTVCTMSFQEMLSRAPKDERLLQDNCAASAIVQVLLLRGYGFDQLTFPRISFLKKAGGASVGWALGYMLSLSNLLPAEGAGLRKGLRPGAWGVLLFIFILLLSVTLGYLLVHASRRKKGGGEMI